MVSMNNDPPAVSMNTDQSAVSVNTDPPAVSMNNDQSAAMVNTIKPQAPVQQASGQFNQQSPPAMRSPQAQAAPAEKKDFRTVLGGIVGMVSGYILWQYLGGGIWNLLIAAAVAPIAGKLCAVMLGQPLIPASDLPQDASDQEDKKAA